MFSNHISTRELFNGSQSAQDNYQNDFSQLQHAQFSQFDMSQPLSQDFLSQDQYSAGSNSQSQGRRGAAVDKHLAKPSLFRSNSQSRISTLSRAESQAPRKSGIQANSYQQQVALQKQKAKDRDERDMLSSIVSMVRDCSDEVKHNLKCMRSTENDNGEVLQSSIKSLSESLEESSHKILKAIKEREDHNNQLAALHREIRQKDERIQELLLSKKSSPERETSRDSPSLLESMKSFMVEQQSQTEHKIQRLLESTQEQLKLTKELGSSHRSGVEENNKHFLDIKYTNSRQVQDIEKRLIDELVTIRDDFTRQKRDLESFLRNQLHSTQQKHLGDIDEHVQKSMIEGLKQVSEKSEKLLEEKHAEFKAISKSQQRDLEKYIKSHSSDQTKQILKQNQDMYNKHQKDWQKEVNQRLENLTVDQKELIQENKQAFNVLKNTLGDEQTKPWQNENVPKLVQDKLNDLHNFHQAEIKRLKTEIENQRKTTELQKDNKLTKEIESIENCKLQNVYDLQHDVGTAEDEAQLRRNKGPVFKNGPGLLSPRPPQGTSWNSRMLFCRPNPSPVATVLPQRIQKQDNILTNKTVVQAIQALQPIQPSQHVQQQPVVDSSENKRQLRKRTIDKQEESVLSDTENLANVGGNIGTDNTNQDLQDDTVSHLKSRKRKAAQRKGGRKGKKKGKQARNKHHELSEQSQNLQDSENKCLNASTCKNEMNNSGSNTISQKEKKSQNGISAESTGSSLTSPVNVYDFHDELSPGPVLRKRITPTYCDTKSKWSVASDSNSGHNSTDSSPSLSVTDIFIRTNVSDKRTSNKHEEQSEAVKFSALSDFLSTPNLTELYTEKNKVCISTSKQDIQNVRPLRRIGEKRKLCEFQPHFQMFHQQKSKRN